MRKQFGRAVAVRDQWRGRFGFPEYGRGNVRKKRVFAFIGTAYRAFQNFNIMLADKQLCGNINKLIADKFFSDRLHFASAHRTVLFFYFMDDFLHGKRGKHFFLFIPHQSR